MIRLNFIYTEESISSYNNYFIHPTYVKRYRLNNFIIAIKDGCKMFYQPTITNYSCHIKALDERLSKYKRKLMKLIC